MKIIFGGGAVLFLVMAAGFLFSSKPTDVEKISNENGVREVAYTNEGNHAAVSEPKEADDDLVIKQFNNDPVRILFGGDMMFDRYIRTMARRQGNDSVFAGVADELRAVDMVVANLEGPITDEASVSETSKMGERANYVFTFHPSWAETIKRNNIGVVNLGNNHVLNFGEKGLEETEKFLDEAGVEYFGDVPNTERRYLIVNVGGVKIGLVNYNQFSVHSDGIATSATGGLAMTGKGKGEDRETRTLEDIRAARQESDVVVVYTHWGVEYEPATNEEKRLAHEFVDAGADAVIGSHPHVTQESETYQGKKIYYSLGNFIFDQYFRSDTRAGLLVEMSVDPEMKQPSFRDIPIELKSDGRTALAKNWE